jgi:hypothetical protein
MAENTKIIISAVDKTKRGFGSVTSGLKKVTGAVFSMRTALVGVAGIAGFGLLVRSSLNSVDSLAKTASKIGTTTEALGKLRYAAELSGVATTTVDMAMQRFTRRLAEAAKGTGEAKGALKELNIDARSLMNLSLDEQVLALSKAFAKQKYSADKVRLAMKLFDSEGVALVNTLGLGSEALKEMFGEAEALGFLLSSEAAKGVEETNDQITKLGRIIKGVKDQFSAALAPAIKFVVERLQELILEAKGADGTFQSFGKSLALSFLNATKTAVHGLDKILEATATFFQEAQEYFDSWDLRAARSQLNHLERRLDAAGEAVMRVGAGDMGILTTITEATGGLITFRSAHGTLVKEAGAKYNNILLKVQKLKEEMLAYQKVDDPSKPSFLRDLISPEFLKMFDDVIAKVEEVQTAVATVVTPEGAESLSVYQRAVAALKLTFEDFKKTLPTVEEGVTSLTNNAMSAFTKGFTDAITGAEKFSDAMKTMAKSVIDSLIEMLVQYYITQQIFGAITSMFPTGGGGTSTAPNTNMGANLGSRSFNGGGFTGMGSRSGGVDGKGGFPAILHPNETVTDHTKGQSSGGVVVNQTINVTTGVQQTVRAEIVQLMPQIAQAAKGAVADARLRGGNFSKAMGGA